MFCTPVLHSYSVTTVLQQLLLFTVVTMVVTSGTLCLFTVSLSSSLFVQVLGLGPVV